VKRDENIDNTWCLLDKYFSGVSVIVTREKKEGARNLLFQYLNRNEKVEEKDCIVGKLSVQFLSKLPQWDEYHIITERFPDHLAVIKTFPKYLGLDQYANVNLPDADEQVLFQHASKKGCFTRLLQRFGGKKEPQEGYETRRLRHAVECIDSAIAVELATSGLNLVRHGFKVDIRPGEMVGILKRCRFIHYPYVTRFYYSEEDNMAFIVLNEHDVVCVTSHYVGSYHLPIFDIDNGFVETNWTDQVPPSFKNAFTAWKTKLSTSNGATWDDPIFT